MTARFLANESSLPLPTNLINMVEQYLHGQLTRTFPELISSATTLQLKDKSTGPRYELLGRFPSIVWLNPPVYSADGQERTFKVARCASQLKASSCANCEYSTVALKHKKICSNCYGLRLALVPQILFSKAIWLCVMDYCFENGL